LDSVRGLVEEIKVPEFTPKSGVKIQVEEKKGEEEKKEEPEEDEDDFKILDDLKAELNVETIGVKSSDFSPADFEKDDDSNFHIDFMSRELRNPNSRQTEHQNDCWKDYPCYRNHHCYDHWSSYG